MNGIPAFGDNVMSRADGFVERADGLFGPSGEQVARRLEREHQALKALQKRVVEFARDAPALVEALPKPHIEFSPQLADP